MGQGVRINKRWLDDAALRYDVDRSLTGMAHETFTEAPSGDRPSDRVAQRLFALPSVRRVHVFSNVITVSVADRGDELDMDRAIKELFIHYHPGVTPTPVDSPQGADGA